MACTRGELVLAVLARCVADHALVFGQLLVELEAVVPLVAIGHVHLLNARCRVEAHFRLSGTHIRFAEQGLANDE
jgi:hypothetical protein